MSESDEALNNKIETVTVGAKNPRPKQSKAARKAARRPARPAAAAIPVPPGEGDSELARSLNSVFGQILSAERDSRDAKTAEQALETIRSAVASLDDNAFRILNASEEFQELVQKVSVDAGETPGQPIYDANGRQIDYVPFSYQWCEQHFPMVEYTPRRNNNSISWNGVSISFREGERTRVPSCFVDIEEESIARERDASQRQRIFLEHGPRAAADGFTHEIGWYKESDEELIKSYGIER